MGQYRANSQCVIQNNIDKSLTVEGISNGIDHYYQNLIIQDIALASQKAFRDISLHFDFRIQYVTDNCRPGQIEIKVLPVTITSYPLFYQGYDISHAVKPEKADLVFHLIHSDNYVSDSLIFTDIPVDYDSSLYTSLITQKSDLASDIRVAFSRAVFHYTKSSYELFRDHILGVDRYYAALLIADSAVVWAETGFLSEKGAYAELVLRQIELERVMNYIRPQQFESLLFTDEIKMDDLIAKYDQLRKLNTRLKAIIRYNKTGNDHIRHLKTDEELVNIYLNWYDHYKSLSYKSNFRYFNFIDGLGIPEYSNADLAGLQSVLSLEQMVPEVKIKRWEALFVKGLMEKGDQYENNGDQLRALKYYHSVYDLSLRLFLGDVKNDALKQAGRMKDSISTSYLQISRKSAMTENPSMAAQYYKQAVTLFNSDYGKSTLPSWLKTYESWLYQNFENQAVKYIDLKNYRKAMPYLIEIELRCQSDEAYPCPEQFYEWMRLTREGIYHELLLNAKALLAREDYQEAGQKYRQAITMRLGAGYRIAKDFEETSLELKFRQLQYEELFEEGRRFFEKEEYSSALYFFNKAEYLAKSGLQHPEPELEESRQSAARKVILNNLSEGRVKVWANDFESANTLVELVRTMLLDYNIGDQDSLTWQYHQLAENVKLKKCAAIKSEYEEMMAAAKSAGEGHDYILAHKLVCDAVNLSMDNLECEIRDEEAWYQKVLLEAPAEYQQMEKDLEALVYLSNSDYVDSFQELRIYYKRHKLLNQGISFTPLFDRVIMARDSAFVIGMLDFYLKMKDYDHAFILLKRINELKIPSSILEDRQKKIAGYMAERDAGNDTIAKPWDTLRSYVGHDKWYRTFRGQYKRTWLRETKWKLKYWPFIWKK